MLRRAAGRAGFTLDLEAPALAPSATGVDGLLGRVARDRLRRHGGRLVEPPEGVPNHGCRWAFYDYSRNRSASWCSMQLCGNRTKTRAYRRRHGASA